MLCRQTAARSLRAAAQGAQSLAAGWAACNPERLATSFGNFRTAIAISRSGHGSSGRDADVHSTTVLCVRKDNQVVLVADGQVTMGGTVVKPNVRKTRKIGESAMGGFAGATADAFTLFERLEHKLEEHSGQLTRASVELAKMWRTDKFLRRLDAALIVADRHQSLQITGNGDVLEPHDGVIAIGSGSPYALAAARALLDQPGLDALAIARKAMGIAADACIYTNHQWTALCIDKGGPIEEVDLKAAAAQGSGGSIVVNSSPEDSSSRGTEGGNRSIGGSSNDSSSGGGGGRSGGGIAW